jgi:hypothetical protein
MDSTEKTTHSSYFIVTSLAVEMITYQRPLFQCRYLVVACGRYIATGVCVTLFVVGY